MRFPMERLPRRIDELAQHVFRARAPQAEWRVLPGSDATRVLPAADNPSWRTIRVGEWWGQEDATPWAWFHRTVTVPAEWAGQRVALYLRLGESLRANFPEARRCILFGRSPSRSWVRARAPHARALRRRMGTMLVKPVRLGFFSRWTGKCAA